MKGRLVGLGLGGLAGLAAATQMFAWTYRFDPVLGPGWRPAPALAVYPPWSILSWRLRFADQAPDAIARAGVLLLLGGVGGLGLGVLFDSRATPRRRGWGGLGEARAAGLLETEGAVLGLMRGRLLATTDLRPTLVTGGTRSGKGRGHVAPTLLSWPESVLVHDPKGELWRLSAGWRSGFSHTLWLAPRRPGTARWNPLAETKPATRQPGQPLVGRHRPASAGRPAHVRRRPNRRPPPISQRKRSRGLPTHHQSRPQDNKSARPPTLLALWSRRSRGAHQTANPDGCVPPPRCPGSAGPEDPDLE